MVIDPDSGRVWVAGVAKPLTPRMSYTSFCTHPASKLMPEVRFRRAPNHHTHRLPTNSFEGLTVLGTAGFTNNELESLWLQLADDKEQLFRHEHEDARLLQLQERWLQEVVGVASGDYPWGLVWNRFNINAGWHDIAVFFNRC